MSSSIIASQFNGLCGGIASVFFSELIFLVKSPVTSTAPHGLPVCSILG